MREESWALSGGCHSPHLGAREEWREPLWWGEQGVTLQRRQTGKFTEEQRTQLSPGACGEEGSGPHRYRTEAEVTSSASGGQFQGGSSSFHWMFALKH